MSLHVPGRGLSTVMAHRLVYELKVGPIQDGMQIDHIDGNKTNNRPDNLEAVTGLENMRRSHARGRTKPWEIARKDGRTWRGKPMLTIEQRNLAMEMRASGSPLREIAASLGIGITHAQRITAGATTP